MAGSGWEAAGRLLSAEGCTAVAIAWISGYLDLVNYYLRQFMLGAAPSIDITDEENAAITTSIANILKCLRFEEEWDLLTGNFYDMEREGLNTALYDMVFGDLDWQDFQDVRIRFTRRLQNLLTSCRSYIDRVPQCLGELDQSGALKSLFVGEKSKAYDDSFGYRFMEALRNHAQHNGHPVHGAMFDRRRVEEKSGDLWRYITGANIDLAELEHDPKFKKSVLQEARDLGDKLDAFRLAREYVEKLGDIHQAVRKHLIAGNYVNPAPVADAIERYEKAGGERHGLAIFQRQPDASPKRTRSVFIEPFDRFERLRRRNRTLHNLSRSYASGELRLPGT
jgi:hypothetical protein